MLVAARDANGAETGRVVVAVDTLDARAGEDVTVAFGSGARNVLRPGAEEPRSAVRRGGRGHRRGGGLMFLGRVAGTVWSTVKWPEARGLKLLLVRPYRLGDLGARRG